MSDLFTRGIPTPSVAPGHTAPAFHYSYGAKTYLQRVGRGGKKEVTWLHARDYQDLWSMTHELPTLAFAIQESQKRLFGTPFEITLGGSISSNTPWKRGGQATAGRMAVPLTELTEEFRDQVVARFWMPWLIDMDSQRRAFGVAPYYFEPMPIRLEQAMMRRSRTPGGAQRTLVHYVPQTPPVGSGRIGTRLEKAHQVLVWEWSEKVDHRRAGQEDPAMLWMVDRMPTLQGRFRSQFVPLLADWRYISRMRSLDVAAAVRNVAPGGMVTYSPSVGGATGSSSATASGTAYIEGAGRHASYPGTAWGAGSGGGGGGGAGASALEDVEDFRTAQLGGDRAMSTGDGMVGTDLYSAAAIAIDSDAENKLELQQLLHNNPALRGQLHLQQAQYPEGTFFARPYEQYHPLPAPRPAAPNLLQYIARLDRHAAIVAGYPLDQVAGATAGSAAGGGSDRAGGSSGSGSGALASTESTNRFVIGHLRALAKFYANVVRDAYLQAYGESFRRARKSLRTDARRMYKRAPQPEELVALDELLKVDVVFPRVPLVSTQDMAYFYSLRMIDEKDFFLFSMNTLGLDDLDKPPAGYRQAVQAHFPSVPLEMQQFELQKEAQKEQIALQKKQHALAVAQHPEQARQAKEAQKLQTTQNEQTDGSSENDKNDKNDKNDQADEKPASERDQPNDKASRKRPRPTDNETTETERPSENKTNQKTLKNQKNKRKTKKRKTDGGNE